MSQNHQYTLAEIQAMLAIPENPTDREVWSQSVLQLLGGILSGVGGGGLEPTVKIDQTGTNNGVQLVGGTQRTAAVSQVTSSAASPVAAGKKSVAFIFSSDFAGTIAGVAIDPSKAPSIEWSAFGPDTLGSIAYTVTAGTLTIATLT